MAEVLGSDLLLKNYGYIRIKLGELLKERGFTVYYLSKVSQVNYGVVKRWCTNDRLEKLDTDILARFCHVLRCDLSTLIEYVPGEKEVG